MPLNKKNTSNSWEQVQEWFKASKKTPKSMTSSVSIPYNRLKPLYNNDGATSAVSIVLPHVAYVQGQELTFDVIDAYQFAVGPQNTEKFIGGTNGKSKFSATAGASITVGATADGWIVRGSYGTWSDET